MFNQYQQEIARLEKWKTVYIGVNLAGILEGRSGGSRRFDWGEECGVHVEEILLSAGRNLGRG